MPYTYAVIGAGRQGSAAAFDLARFGNTQEVRLIDVHYAAAMDAALKINRLLQKPIASACGADIRKLNTLRPILRDVDGCIAATHYLHNLLLTRLAVELGSHMCDLGGKTEITRSQHEYHDGAKKAGIAIIPNCGMGPGMNLSLANYAAAHMAPEEILIYCGGLPQYPREPLRYELLFNLDGLVNEYSGFADVIRDGALTSLVSLGEIEPITIEGVGEFEAALTSGGLSLAPWTFKKMFPTLKRLEYKTLRYHGHWAIVENWMRRGTLKEKLAEALGTQIKDVPDIGIIEVRCRGKNREGSPLQTTIRVVDRYDATTGFSAMQRLTGFHASIILIMAVRNMIQPGVIPVETINGLSVVEEMKKRGFAVYQETKLCAAS